MSTHSGGAGNKASHDGTLPVATAYTDSIPGFAGVSSRCSGIRLQLSPARGHATLRILEAGSHWSRVAPSRAGRNSAGFEADGQPGRPVNMQSLAWLPGLVAGVP